MAGKNLYKAWHRFIQTNFNAYKWGAPDIHKERKYEHIEIQKDFEEIEKKRSLQRLTLIEYKKKLRKQLLEQQLEIAKTQPQELLEQQEGKKFAGEVKHAEDIKKYGGFQSFEEFSKNLEASKRQITETKDQTIASKGDLEKELARLSSDIERIRATKGELEKVEQEIEELEPNYILVTGMQKKLVLNAIAYYEFQYRNLQGVVMNPETMKSIETVHYHVDHNLPVRRELLYEVVPELFEVELGELQQYERERILAKRPKFLNRNDAIIRAVDEPPEERSLEELEEFKKQEMDFMEFVYAKAGEFTNKHFDHIEQKINLGFGTTELVLENIENKPENERTDVEKEVFTDLQELKRINNDYADLIKLNQAKIYAKQRELYVPDFVKQNDRLHKMWVQRWEELVSNSFEFADSVLVPDNSANYESRLDHVLKQQSVHDINELIAQSQVEYKAKTGSTDEPTKLVDRNQKNPELLQRLDLLTGAMQQIPLKKKAGQRDLEHFQANIGHSETSEEGRILLDELTKILYLNNKDPAKYNLIYWAEHFNIQPQKLRNIFNFVTYGVPDQKNPKDIGRVLRFIYDNSTLTEEQKEMLGQAQM